MEKWFGGFSGCFQGIRVYIGEETRSGELRGAHEGGVAPTPLGAPSCLMASSWSSRQSSGFLSVQERSSRRFHSVWTPFGIPFLQNSKIGKRTKTGLGPSVVRLLPKII